MNELDENKIATIFLEKSLPLIADLIYDKSLSVQNRRGLKRSIQKYFSQEYTKNARSKSYFFQDEPQPFYDFYIHLDVTIGIERLSKFSYNEAKAISDNLVIVGLAGSGKSLLMKHMFLNALENGGEIPIFLEIRDFNNSKLNFGNWMIQKISRISSAITKEKFENLIKGGKIALFLDGYDEVIHEKRAEVCEVILDLSGMSQGSKIIVSSRPDDTFQGWRGFTKLSVCGLNRSQSLELLEKLDYPKEAKDKFVSELKGKLFQTHESFTKNPLLLTIMLITYGKNADIPNKRSLFYEQAFEALFQKHDAAKGIFKRSLLSNLDIADYTQIFSLFSLYTYAKRKFQFSYREAIQYIKSASESVGIEVSADDVLSDAKQGINLLVDDGVDLSYSHRSFQEFFVAQFISDCSAKIAKKLLIKFAPYSRSDEVYSLVCEMNLAKFEECLVVPVFQRLFKRVGINGDVTPEALLRYIKGYWLMIGIGLVTFEDENDDGAAAEPKFFLNQGKKYSNDLEAILWCFHEFEWNFEKQKEGMPMEEIAKKYFEFEAEFEEAGSRVNWLTSDLELDTELFLDIAQSGSVISLSFLEGARIHFVKLTERRSTLEDDIELLLKGK